MAHNLFVAGHLAFGAVNPAIAARRANVPARQLLLAFLQRGCHILAVVNKAGDQLGIVALDDVFEKMLGHSIKNEKHL